MKNYITTQKYVKQFLKDHAKTSDILLTHLSYKFPADFEVRDKVKPNLEQFSNRISHELIVDNQDEYDSSFETIKHADSKRSHYLKRLQSKPILEKMIRLSFNFNLLLKFVGL